MTQRHKKIIKVRTDDLQDRLQQRTVEPVVDAMDKELTDMLYAVSSNRNHEEISQTAQVKNEWLIDRV